MVQPKYNPQEALERVKLMMNYDLSKTSTENKKVIEEQKTEEKGRFSCIKNYYKSKNVPYKEYSYKSGRGKGLMVDLPNETWFFDVPSKSWRKLVVANFVEKGKWECDGNANFIITKNDGTVYKSSDSNVNPQPAQTQPVAQPAQTQPVAQPAQTQPVAQPAQTQPNSDPFACVKNYALLKRVEISTPTKGGNYIWATFVDTSGNVTDWFFEIRNGNNEWSEMVNGKFKPVSDKTGYGKWECDGNKNFKITKNDGSIYKSSDVNTSQTVQPVDQPKADNKQGTPDPSKPQKLKPKDSPLGTTLKDTSIPKRSCVVYVDQLFEAWERSRGQKFDTNQINELRGYVQRCMDDHFPSGSKQGNWGITGLGGGKTDQKLLQLSACKAPAPSQSGPDSIFRLVRKC